MGMKIKPHVLIPLVSFVIGTAYLVLTPPFQVPDEINHFYRACHIASGRFSAERLDDRLGGHLPEYIADAPSAFQFLRGNPFTRTNYQYIYHQIKKNISSGQTRFVDFPNMALYTPISYAPQAFAAKIGLSAGFSPVLMLYLIRLTVLCGWSLALFFSLRALPAFGWQLGLLALLPMTLFVNMSASADAITNILGLLWIGSIVKLAFGNKKITPAQIAGMTLLAALIASAKYVYTPLVLLIFAIPAHKFPARRRWPITLAVGGFAFALAYWCSSYASSMYISHEAYNPEFVVNVDVPKGCDINGQMQYLKTNPLQAPEVIVRSFLSSRIMLAHTYIGVFGWLDARLSWFWVTGGYLLIAGLFFLKNPGLQFTLRQRVIFISVALIVTGLIYLSQYLSWAAVGSTHCGSIQGRYFIVVFPLLLIGLARAGQSFLGLRNMLIAGFMALLLAGGVKLYQRYYSIPPKTSDALYCDAEKIWVDEYMGNRYFYTNIPGQMAGNGLTYSSEAARSGAYSCKVTPAHPYGMTFLLYNFEPLDTIHAEVWYKGRSAHLWLVNEAIDLFLSQYAPTVTDSLGWSKLEITYPIGPNRPAQGFGVFVSAQDTCYFDDLRVRVQE